MRQSVRDVFFDFTAQREGFTPFLYADTLNLVTTGVGNLVDAGPNHGGVTSVERARLNNEVSAAAMLPAMRLPWKVRGPGWTSKNPVAGALVSPSEVADAWTKVKQQNVVAPNFSQKGGGAYAGLTSITLDLNDIKDLFSTTLDRFDATLAKKYAGYTTWPADAQLAVLSMSWAMGPAFDFPQFKSAMDQRDFTAAIPLAFFKGGGGTPSSPTGRNAENREMLANAATVEKGGGDPDRLIFSGTSRGVVPSTPGPSLASNVSTFSQSAVSTAATAGKFGLAALAVGALGFGGWTLWKRSSAR